MDETAKYNIERWKRLADANALFTRPALDLDASSARELLDPDGRLGEVTGRNVLCLAGGGGKQSVAFGLLGANVTAVDLSESQLQRDHKVAALYNLKIETMQSDMPDLSGFGQAAFDVVWQPYSLNFVPDARQVFREVARVLRHDGMYYFNCANPFFMGLSEECWNGAGYTLKQPYIDGTEVSYNDQEWVYDRASTRGKPIPGPREYCHTLSTLVNGLIEQGFSIRHLSDSTDFTPNPKAEPGTWDHFTSIAPPWLTFWTVYSPEP